MSGVTKSSTLTHHAKVDTRVPRHKQKWPQHTPHCPTMPMQVGAHIWRPGSARRTRHAPRERICPLRGNRAPCNRYKQHIVPEPVPTHTCHAGGRAHGAQALHGIQAAHDGARGAHERRAARQVGRHDHRQHLRRQAHRHRQPERQRALVVAFAQSTAQGTASLSCLKHPGAFSPHRQRFASFRDWY